MSEQPADDTRDRWKILLLEDDEDDYILARSWLTATRGDRFEIAWARALVEALEKIETFRPDAILVDYDLGAYNGLEFLRELVHRECPAAVIMLTGRGSYEIDMEAMQAGATDYLAKNEATPQLLERTIRYAMERKQREAALRRAKEELETRVRERTQQLMNKNAALEAEIAERMRVQAELSEMQRRSIEGVEAERLKLAQELHDGPMQDLYALAYQLERLRTEADGEQREELVRSLQAKVQALVHTLRSTTGELRPPTLAPFGLEKAIRSHCEAFGQAQPDLKIRLHLTPDGQSLPDGVRLALFRIYQVALTNVARHAQARQVDIRLLLDAESVILEIQDDGIGFNVPERLIELARQGQYGIVGAAERAAAVGGKLRVESQPGKGTRLRVEVPLE